MMCVASCCFILSSCLSIIGKEGRSKAVCRFCTIAGAGANGCRDKWETETLPNKAGRPAIGGLHFGAGSPAPLWLPTAFLGHAVSLGSVERKGVRMTEIETARSSSYFCRFCV